MSSWQVKIRKVGSDRLYEVLVPVRKGPIAGVWWKASPVGIVLACMGDEERKHQAAQIAATPLLVGACHELVELLGRIVDVDDPDQMAALDRGRNALWTAHGKEI